MAPSTTRGGTPRSATGSLMADPRRGEIWLVDLGAPEGHEQGWRRPALVVSSDHWNRHANTLTVLPLTRNSAGFPTRVEIEPGPRNGLQTASYARCEDIRAIHNSRLTARLGSVGLAEMQLVERTLRTFLEL